MISPQETEQIAKLARLALTKEEIESIGNDLSRVLDYVHKLSEVDTEHITPLNGGGDLINQFRADVQTEAQKKLSSPESVAALVNAAPAKQKGYVKVRSVF